MEIILLLVAVIAVAYGGQIDIPPKDTAAIAGSNINLTCQASGDLSTDRLNWKEHIEEPTGALIFNSMMSGPNDEEEFSIFGKYNLMIKEANIEDGGIYSCGLDLMQQPHKVAVTVFERPQIKIPVLEIGVQQPIECVIHYGGAPPALLKPEQLPKVVARIETDVVQGYETRVQGILGEMSTITYLVNVTSTREDHLRTFSCEVMVEGDADFKLGERKIMTVKHEVWGIETSPKRKTLYVGETLNCGATGHPEPTYKWVDASGTKSTVEGATLKISSSMIGGRNKWRCEATNDAGNGDQTVIEDVDFAVLATTTAPPSSALTVQASGLVVFIFSLITSLL